MGPCNSKTTSSDDDDDISSILGALFGGVSSQNNAGLLTVQKKIQRKINNRKIVGKTKSVSNQSIILNELPREGPIDDFYRQTVSEKKLFGLLGSKNNCRLYGCSYDINQVSNIKINSYNESVLEETETILSEIEQQMEQEAEAAFDGDQGRMDIANDARNEVRDEVRQAITNNLNSLTSQDTDTDQSITINWRSPPSCTDPCGWSKKGRRGPELSQNAQLEIISDQIIKSAIEIYEKKYKEVGLEVTQSVKSENTACILFMSVSLVGCFICLIIVWKIIQMMSE